MKTIIAGSRIITDYEIVKDAIKASGFTLTITEVVSGEAKGVDALGEQYAHENNIPIKGYPADWESHGRKAGPIRNAEMAAYAEACLVIWDGKSKGSKNMIENAKKKSLLLRVYLVE